MANRLLSRSSIIVGALVVLAAMAFLILFLADFREVLFEEDMEGTAVEGTPEYIDRDAGVALDTLPDALTLVHYQIEPAARVLSGTVMNNAEDAYVDVQVGFDLFDATGNRVAAVGDTLGLLEPGDSWEFSIPLPLDKNVTRAVNTGIEGNVPEVRPGEQGGGGLGEEALGEEQVPGGPENEVPADDGMR